MISKINRPVFFFELHMNVFPRTKSNSEILFMDELLKIIDTLQCVVKESSYKYLWIYYHYPTGIKAELSKATYWGLSSSFFTWSRDVKFIRETVTVDIERQGDDEGHWSQTPAG